MTDVRDLARRMDRIEADGEEQSPREWAEELVDQQIAETDAYQIVDDDRTPSDLEFETEDGVLVFVVENDHYWSEYRAPREEIPDHFAVDEDFPA